jgi:hypothetical protein
MGDMFPGAGKQRTAESMSGTTWLSFQLATSLYPVRTKRNVEESDGTVIISLERLLGLSCCSPANTGVAAQSAKQQDIGPSSEARKIISQNKFSLA